MPYFQRNMSGPTSVCNQQRILPVQQNNCFMEAKTFLVGSRVRGSKWQRPRRRAGAGLCWALASSPGRAPVPSPQWKESPCPGTAFANPKAQAAPCCPKASLSLALPVALASRFPSGDSKAARFPCSLPKFYCLTVRITKVPKSL